MPGHRVDCIYCKKSILSRDIGRHIITTHAKDLFTDSNLKALHRDKYLDAPLELCLDTDTYYFCLADNSCIRHRENATRHFVGKVEKHRGGMYILREKFPLTEQPGTAPQAPLLTEKDKKRLQDEMVELLGHLWTLQKKYVKDTDDHFVQSKRVIEIYNKFGITYDIKELMIDYPNIFPQDAPEEEEEQQEELETISEAPVEDDTDTVFFQEKKIVAAPMTHPSRTAFPTPNLTLPPPPPAAPSLKILSSTKRLK